MLGIALGDGTTGARPRRGGLGAPCLPVPCQDSVWKTSRCLRAGFLRTGRPGFGSAPAWGLLWDPTGPSCRWGPDGLCWGE